VAGSRFVPGTKAKVTHRTPEESAQSNESKTKGPRMNDPTEAVRREMVAEINAEPGSREYLEAKHGQVWDTDQVRSEFEVLGFLAPFVVVRRRSDGVKGSLMFQHDPRFYFGFQTE
jgi:hypothetical protein